MKTFLYPYVSNNFLVFYARHMADKNITSMKTIWVWVLALFLASTTAVFAQPVTVSVSILRPTPLQLSTWRTNPAVVTLSLVSPLRDYTDVIIGIEVANLSTGDVARTNNTDSRMPRFSLRRGVPLSLNGRDIINQQTISAPAGLQESITRSGALPEGDYTFCVTLFERDGRTEIVSTGKRCENFSILWSDPPVLISPLNVCDLSVATSTNFTWQSLAPAPAEAVFYRIKIVGVVGTQLPRVALESNTELVLDEVVPTTVKVITPNFAPFVDLINRRAPQITRFAWQVQALNAARTPIFTRGGTQGKSEIGLFDFRDRPGSCGTTDSPPAQSCTDALNVTNYFPVATDTIPWLPPHMIMQWGPFCADVKECNYTMSVREIGGSFSATNVRTLNWRRGIYVAQGIDPLASNAMIRAQRLITNMLDESGTVPRFNEQLRYGSTYEWGVDATFIRNESGREQRRTANSARTQFSLGLKMPTTPEPRNEAVLESGENVRLAFTIPPPAQLAFDPLDLVNRTGSGTSMSFGSASESIRVRVSRTRDMRSPILSRTVSSPQTDIFRTGDNAALLFGEKRYDNNTFRDNGTYYWQVEYLDPADTNRVYRQGPVWQFTITASTPIDMTECVRVTPISPENRGTLSSNRPLFSISTQPRIALSAVRGGRIRIWEMRSGSENPEDVQRRTPVGDFPFTGNSETDIRFSPGVPESASRSYINLPFLNGSESAPQQFRPRNSITYMWTAELNIDGTTIRADGQPCTKTRIMSSAGIFSYREGCSDVCIKAAPTNTTPSTAAFTVGSTITIGHFTARLTRVSGTGSSLSGEATVTIPVFRGGIRVDFSGIRVNSDNEVFEGELRAIQADDSPLRSDVANALTGALGLSREDVTRVHSYSSDARRLVSNLVEGTPVGLPIGFDRVVEGQRVTVGIIGMQFRPTNARLNVVASFPAPFMGPGQRIGFGARNICFYPGGFGREVDIGLADDLGYTATDTAWSFNFLSPRENSAGVVTDSGTFLRFGCNGFEFIRLKAEVAFPRTWMKKVDVATNRVVEGEHVKAQFTTIIRSTGDILAEATMDRFTPAGAPDFIMQVDTVSFDFSERENPSSLRFPDRYRGVTTNEWKGFFINRVYCSFPEQLRTFDSDRPLNAELRTLLIDRSGITFFARVNNIVRYPRGNIGGWGASIDTIGIDVVSSSLENGRLVGNFMVPISDSTSKLEYRATLAHVDTGSSRGIQFTFNVQPRDTLRIPLWVASLRLNPTSYVRVTAGAAQRFLAQANFSGGISLAGDAGGIPLSFTGISFENFRIQTSEPYVSCDRFSFASPQHGFFSEVDPALEPPNPDGAASAPTNGGMSGFPISIGGIGIAGGTRDGGRPGLGIRFTISVNLQPGNNAVSGGTTLSVWGALETGSGPMRAVFDGVDLDSIGIRADMGAVDITGAVRFYRRDPTFGTGFRGEVSANFVKMLTISATMQFGAKPVTPSSREEFRYWYVDARVTLATGLVIPAMPAVGIYGFGGGAWYNMIRETPSTSPGGGLSAGDRSLLAGTTSGASSTPSSTPGATNSGTRYVPSYSPLGATFGFYGMITLGTYPKPDAFNVDIRLEISFAAGGINEIRLRGDGYMLAGLDNRRDAKVTMLADISYNFPRRIFHGIFRVDINAAVVTGSGQITMHFAPDTWHIKIGDPEGERVSINLMNMLRIQAYMMCGLNLPNSMAIPREISEVIAVPPMPRGMAELRRGDGFAFGASLDFNPGELRFLIFYASMRLFMGFDVAFLNYGADAMCANNGSPMGINGWYATGQMYGRIDASIGINVDLMFVQGRFEILGLRAAAIIRAGLPNPTWLQGSAGGEYRILGGLIQGRCQFDFTIGEECRPITETALTGVDWYNQISPANGANDVSVYVQPSVAANLPISKPFCLEEPNGDGSTTVKIFRIQPRSFILTQVGSSVVPSSNSVNAQDPYFVVQTPSVSTLRQRTQYTSAFTAQAQQFTGVMSIMLGGDIARFLSMRDEQRLEFLSQRYSSESNWSGVTYRMGERRGQLVEKTISTTFTTEVLPDSIRPQEVSLSYPRNRQRFFLQDECRNGRIDLLNNREDLFATGTGLMRNEYFLRFISIPGNTRVEVPMTYSPSTPAYYIGESRSSFTAEQSRSMSRRGGTIQFEIPTLVNNTMYGVQVIRRRVNIAAEDISTIHGSFRSAMLGTGGRTASSTTIRSVTSAPGLASSMISTSRGAVMTSMYSTLLERYGSSLSVQRKTLTGFDVGRTVGENEKLLYVMFFKTSRYNRLQQKLQTLTNTPTSATTRTWNLQTLKTAFTGVELFDSFDVDNQTVELGTDQVRSYMIPKLISTYARRRTSRWHTDFVNPMIYDAIEWMRSTLRMSSMMPNGRQTYWDRAVRLYDENFIDAPATDSPLNDWEISSITNPSMLRSMSMLSRLRFTTQTRISGTGSGLSFGTSSITPSAYQWNIHFTQPGFIGFTDFGLARTYAARIRSHYCGGDVGFTEAECRRLLQIATQVWRYPEDIRPSRYQIDMFYNYCPVPDGFDSYVYPLNFTY